MSRPVFSALLAICLTSTAVAQRDAGNSLPKVGSLLPDVTAYDAAGQEFSLSELRGDYSVLVFGCLT